MPEIPRYFRQQGIPGESGGVPVNPAAASMSYEAVEKGGKAIAGLGEEAMRYAIVEQRAERALKAMKFETDLKNDVDATAESYAMRSDYDKFDNDVQANIALLKQKHVDSIEDPVLKRAAEATFGKQSYELQKVIRDKKRVLMTEEATNQYGVKYNNALKEYAYSTSPEEKEFIRNNVALEGYELEKSHLLKLGSTEKLMQAFDQKVEEYVIAQQMNEDPEKLAMELRKSGTFPNTDPKKKEELIYRADERAYREEIRKDREVNLARKEVHDTNAKDAFDRFELWKKGKKSADGKSLEDWLDENRGTDAIRESTYEHYMGRIDKAKDRTLATAEKWSVAKRVQFGQIKQKFLDPANNYSWSDIPGLVKGLPVSAADELSDILVSQPSKERRQAIQVSESFINKKLKEAEASPETWESTMAQWKYRAKDAPLENLQKIANEITAGLPQGGLSAMLEEIKKKKGMKQEDNKQKTIPKQTEAATPPQTGYRYNPVTGNFEEIK